jgi:hypothetical protein
MNGLVKCSRMGKEIQLSAGQCGRNYQEAEEWQELGWPLYVRAKCLGCRNGAAILAPPSRPASVGAASSRPGRVEPAPTTANRPVGRESAAHPAIVGVHPTPQPAIRPDCRVCGLPGWGKSGLCFEHLLAQSLLRVEQKRACQRRHVARKRGINADL